MAVERKKIVVGKSDEAAVVAEKIITASSRDIILSIPRFSKLAESEVNFRLIKREAEALGKRVVLESVDSKVIAAAKAAGLPSVDPFFGGARAVSDITTSSAHRSFKRPVSDSDQEINHDDRLESTDEPAVPARTHRLSGRRFHFRLPGGRRILVGAAVLVVIIAAIAVGLTLSPTASIAITVSRVNWPFTDAVIVDTNISHFDIATTKIPGERFTSTKNLQLQFPASGRTKVSEKAKGVITIYNAYSSAPQPLVATTRFATPEGKVFRLTKAVIVPGAKVENGTIVPSSVEAEVIADQPGVAYNVGPVSKFTIPGFAGTPKFEAFYGVSAVAMAGGFVGDAAVATESDITKAKSASTETLQHSIETVLLAQLPADFKVFKESSRFTVTKQSVNRVADESGQFTVSTEGELSLVAFKERDLASMLLAKASDELKASMVVRDGTLTYTGTKLLANGTLQVGVDYQAVLARALSDADIKEKVAGRATADLRSIVLGIPGVEKLTVSLWPAWVRSVPDNAERITVTID